MRDWTLPLLRCLACGRAAPAQGGVLARDGAELRCRLCGARFPVRDDVADFLVDLHAVPARERGAVRGEDRRNWCAEESPEPARRQAERAEASYRSRVEEASAIVAELLELQPLPEPTGPERSLVVEVGADFCWASELLLAHGSRVVATDISEHLVHARAGAADDLCRIQADMNHLPLADGVADAVWATACVHHSWSLEQSFAEIARVLRPGGRAYLCNEPLPSWPRYLLGFGFGRRERELGINETWTWRRSWLTHCRRAGLTPHLVFPAMTRERLARRLARRRLPLWLGPILRPVLPWLSVSIHLIAEKPVRG